MQWMLSCGASSGRTYEACIPGVRMLTLPLESCCSAQEVHSAGEAEEQLARGMLNPEVFESADAHSGVDKELERAFGTLGLGSDAVDAPPVVGLCAGLSSLRPALLAIQAFAHLGRPFLISCANTSLCIHCCTMYLAWLTCLRMPYSQIWALRLRSAKPVSGKPAWCTVKAMHTGCIRCGCANKLGLACLRLLRVATHACQWQQCRDPGRICARLQCLCLRNAQQQMEMRQAKTSATLLLVMCSSCSVHDSLCCLTALQVSKIDHEICMKFVTLQHAAFDN